MFEQSQNISSTSYNQYLEIFQKHQIEYPELNYFRKEINDLSLHHAYLLFKKRAFLYQCIFIGFCCLFAFLGATILLKTSNWISSFYFGNGDLAKIIAYSISFTSSGFALWVGLNVRPEKEAVKHVASMVEENMAKIYSQKHIKCSSNHAVKQHREQEIISFKKIYQDTLDKIHDKKEKTLHPDACELLQNYQYSYLHFLQLNS